MSRLLELVGACVRMDASPSGLTGDIAIGVRKVDAIEWLTIDLSTPPTVQFGEELPSRADAMLIVDEKDAERILHSGKSKAEAGSRVFRGDLRLFEKFVSRYLRPPSVFDLRRSPAPTKTSRTQGRSKR